ncbi:MAG: hypothetical protein KatS3mg097_380 [Candidatus Parcubacteria bacterium]|nr:MAG: hypothetical protein KatS3mg097_380 [Candidatus Parcubacteria bacterium]
MNFLNKKKFHKILLTSVLIFMVLFVDLFNVFSFAGLINISRATSHGSSGSGGVGVGGSLPDVIQVLPTPPLLNCPAYLTDSMWVNIFGENRFGGREINISNSGQFMVCFLFIATQVLSSLAWIAIVFSVLAITYYGILYIVKPSTSSNTTKNITWAVWGLIVSLSAFTLVQLIRWSFFSFNPNLDNIANLSFYWFINKFQFINIAQAYVESGVVQNNNLSFGYLGEKLISGLGLPMLVSLLALTSLPELLGLPDWIGELHNLRLSFCPDLPNVLSPGSIVPPDTWTECAFSFVYMLIYLLSWLALVLSVIFISWFGILYIIQPSEAQKTHSRLKYAFIGLIVSLSAIMIINLISMLFVDLF